jgi:hypothetical protein
MQEEYNSLLKNQTWDLVLLPSDMKLVICRWVYRTKKATNGKVSRYKEILVTKGFQQIHGIEYDETFSPVTRTEPVIEPVDPKNRNRTGTGKKPDQKTGP